MSESTLIAHCGANKVDREFLRTLPVPEATRTHRPVPHIDIVEALVQTLGFRHIEVTREEYAVTNDGMRMFGLLQLQYGIEGLEFAIGLKNGNDKSMRFGLTVGYRVLVCDNLAFMGDYEPVMVKHSARMNLIDVVSIGVDKIQRNFEPLTRQIEDWRGVEIDTLAAKGLIYDAFLDPKLDLPRNLLPAVHAGYFEPQLDEFRPRTLWSMSNSFTSAFKELKPVKQFQATARLGTFIERYNPPFETAKEQPSGDENENRLSAS